MSDIELIEKNAIQYNGPNDPAKLGYRARSMKDVCFAMITRLIEPELDLMCQKIVIRRSKIG